MKKAEGLPSAFAALPSPGAAIRPLGRGLNGRRT